MDGFGMEGLGFPTETSSAQWELELVARDVYARATRAGANETTTTTTGDGDENARANGARGARGDDTDVSGGVAVAATLDRDAHVAYLTRSLTHLGSGFVVLDASRAWLCYWIVHSLALLSHPLAPSTASDVVEFLGKCQRPGGGFGGGPGQMPHLAPTYAAVCCLASIATPEAFACVNRKSLRSFLARCKDDETGGYRMHEGGETDTRGCYTALAVAHLCGVMDDAVTENTHEGGIAGEPGAEAHGGYTFCGLAAAVLCDGARGLDLPELLHWLCMRQGAVEGGFNGRTNKLVDGCYSFWQGGAFPLLSLSVDAVLRAMPPPSKKGATATREEEEEEEEEKERGSPLGNIAGVPACALFPAAASEAFSSSSSDAKTTKTRTLNAWDPTTPPFNARALQGWLLLCCQAPNGGLQDKPGKGRDHYHTCYCLSGLSAAQHWGRDGLVGSEDDVVERCNPVVNVVEARYLEWMQLVDGAGAA